VKREHLRPDRIVLSPCQIVAWNLEKIRRARGLSQDETARKLAPYLGFRMTRAALSQAERCLYGGRIRRFDADEIVAFARAFDVPVSTFFMVPESHFMRKRVVVNGKPGNPRAKVISEPLTGREMTVRSGRATVPRADVDLSGAFGFLWESALRTVSRVVARYLKEHPASATDIAAGSERVIKEILERISSIVLTPAEESRQEDEFLKRAGIKMEER
jgi:hypothetical protein